MFFLLFHFFLFLFQFSLFVVVNVPFDILVHPFLFAYDSDVFFGLLGERAFDEFVEEFSDFGVFSEDFGLVGFFE